ncbi:copper(I)-binding protein [Oxalobacteraceae bacterium GrIS 1.11]
MSITKQLFTFVATMALASCALAQVTVTAPWIRATVPQAKSGGAFMQLQSSDDARLLEVRAGVAGMVEIHQMEMAGQTMRMHAVDGVDLPAGKTVNLASGGYHIMLMDLKRQLKEGESVALTLRIQHKNKKLETLELNVPVKPLTYLAPAAH